MASAHLSRALLTIGLAFWVLPVDRQPVPSPAPLSAFAAAGLAGLYCALIASAFAG